MASSLSPTAPLPPLPLDNHGQQSAPSDTHSPRSTDGGRVSTPMKSPSPVGSPRGIEARSPHLEGSNAVTTHPVSRDDRASSSERSPKDLSQGESLPMSAGSPGSTGKKSGGPIDTLARLFPSQKRNVLQLVLQGCDGDVLQAIEQVMANQKEEAAAAAAAAAGASNPHLMAVSTAVGTTTCTFPPTTVTDSNGAFITHRPYLPASSQLNTSGMKSAFSPLSTNERTVPGVSTANIPQMRFAYPPYPRGLTLWNPHYPAVIPAAAAFGMRPAGEGGYTFSGLMRDLSTSHKDTRPNGSFSVGNTVE